MANREKKRTLTRKQHSRIDRERRQRRWIFIGTIIVVATVLITITIGIVLEQIIKPRQPVAEVGDTIITTSEFQSYTRYRRFQLVNEYLGTYQYVTQLGDPNSLSYFEPYLQQIQSELDPEILGLNMVNQMVENEIIRKEAQRLGIEVPREEVEEMVQASIFQYYPDGTPTPIPTDPMIPTPTLSDLQKTLLPPTPTTIVTDTLSETTSIVESQSENEENLEEEENGEPVGEEEEIPTPTLLPTAILPTPTIYTERAFQQNYDEYFSYLRSYSRVDEEVIFEYYENLILREKVSDAVITDLPQEEEKLWARHILFRDFETGKEQADAFLDRINAGEDFVTVAEELSSSASEDEQGIQSIVFEDLGWFGEGMMVEAFEAAAQALEVGEISEPVETSFGWHVIQLLGRDVQPKTKQNLDQLQEQRFQAWLAEKRAEYEVNISPDWVSLVPEEPEIPQQALIQPTDQVPTQPVE